MRCRDAETDAFFDGAGHNLHAGMLLAAAVGGRPIAQVFWLTDSTDEEPVRLLRNGGYPMMGDAGLGIIQSTDKLRGSVYSTGQEMAACLRNTQVADWVTRAELTTRARSSMPPSSCAAAARCTRCPRRAPAAPAPWSLLSPPPPSRRSTDLADTSPGGRLRTPLVGILDEAANVCRWRDLPDLYSHFGSRGIPIMSVFQSWSQGVAVFGREGMLKLWSASNAFLYLGSVKENDFLQNVSELVGDYDRETTSASYNKGVRSTSTALKRERILTVDELGAMPRGRAVMLSTGARAALLRTVPWYEGAKDQVAAIKASIAAHDPAVIPAASPVVTASTSAPVSPVDLAPAPVPVAAPAAPPIDLASSMRALMEREDAKDRTDG